MKKALTLIIALVLVFALSAPAFAGTGSVVAPTKSKGSTADMPVVKKTSGVILVPVEKNEELTEEQQAEYAEAAEDVKNVVPEGANVNFLNYVIPEDGPGYLTVELEGDFSEVIAKLYHKGEWTDIDVTDNGNGTYTLFIPTEGVLAVMTK